MPVRPAAAQQTGPVANDEGSGGAGSSKPAAGLYLTAVPIGNAGDITLRALRTITHADAVVCEDTRVTGRLLAIHGLARPLVSYHEHNAERMRPVLLARLAAGESLVLVADAGLPLVSDPGYKLVRAAIAAGHHVTCLPGPSAPTTALLLSGLPTDRHLFAGFPPAKGAARRAYFRELAAVPATLVFFESAQRLAASLADLATVAADRAAAVTRELTKLFEEVRRDSVAALAAHYAAAGPPKGEVTVVVAPPPAVAAADDDAAVDAALRAALARDSVRDAAAAVAAATGRPRREVYRRALTLAADRGAADRGAPNGEG